MQIAVRGDVDQRAIDQLHRCAAAGDALAGALCADGHVGYSQPIGGVVAYPDHISPSGVGYDIACGNKAVRTDLLADDVRPDLGRIMDTIFDRISFGVGRKNDEPVDHPVLDRIGEADFEPQRELRDLAAKQLGTVGAGNHYVDLFAGDDGHVWVGVHFGSRGFGHRTASGFLALAAGRRLDEKGREGEMDSPPVLLHVGSDLGQAYIGAMQLAGEYAYAGRNVVVDRVLEILGARSTYEIHNNHNFCIAGDQIVPTTAGPKRMHEVTAGDEVYAYTDAGPRPTRVMDAWASGEKPIYTISLGSRRIRCSGSHPLLVLSHGTPAWRNAADLTEGDIVVCADGYYPTAGSWGVERARLVGAFLGDGWIRHEGVERRGYSAGLAIGTGQEPHTARYASLVAEQLPNTGWGRGWRIDAPGHYGLSCSSKSSWTAVVELGIGERSEARRVPRDAFRLSREEKLALLAGYFDADGNVASDSTSNRGRGHVASVSRALVEDLRELAIGCGLQVTTVRAERRVTNYKTCVAHRFAIAVASMIEIPLWHRAKVGNVRVGTSRRTKGLSAQYLAGAALPDGFFARRVRSIEVGPPEPVYDLTVEDGSHSFIVEGVVTHNCWRERHFGVDVWVIRKGCTPAFPGQEGFVGATMGEPSVILRGTDRPEGAELLFSTVHGAGRVMSRTQAAGKLGARAECNHRDCEFWVRWSEYRNERERRGIAEGARFTLCPDHPDGTLQKRRGRIKAGRIDFGEVRRGLTAEGIELRGGAADEAPGAYKRLDAVLAAHGDTIEVVHRLTPIGVAMAGADTFDPYKD
jgi:RNA-splicing ligase RtcB